jgi:hypothetical protein
MTCHLVLALTNADYYARQGKRNKWDPLTGKVTLSSHITMGINCYIKCSWRGIRTKLSLTSSQVGNNYHSRLRVAVYYAKHLAKKVNQSNGIRCEHSARIKRTYPHHSRFPVLKSVPLNSCGIFRVRRYKWPSQSTIQFYCLNLVAI